MLKIGLLSKNFENFVTEHGISVKDDLVNIRKQHYQMLINAFKEDYFELLWIGNPFILDRIPDSLTNDEKSLL